MLIIITCEVSFWQWQINGGGGYNKWLEERDGCSPTIMTTTLPLHEEEWTTKTPMQEYDHYMMQKVILQCSIQNKISKHENQTDMRIEPWKD
jgi:hypothetical protein